MSTYKNLLESIAAPEQATAVAITEADKKDKEIEDKADAKDTDKASDSADTDKKDDSKGDKKENFFDKFKKKAKKESVSESEYIAFLEAVIENEMDLDKESLTEAAVEYYNTL